MHEAAMDLPTKRPRSLLECGDQRTNQSHEEQRHDLRLQLKATFENIFHRFEKDFTGIGDEIDLETGQVIVNNGHLSNMCDEHDTASGSTHTSGKAWCDLFESHISTATAPENSDLEGVVDHGTSDTDSVLGERTGFNRKIIEEASLAAYKSKLHRMPTTTFLHNWSESTGPSDRMSATNRSGMRKDYKRRVSRSQSPDRSVWDLEQPTSGKLYAQRHHKTPWDSYNNALLLHLRTVERLSFAQMERCFPGRKAPAIRAHFLSLHDGTDQKFSDLDEHISVPPSGIYHLTPPQVTSRTPSKSLHSKTHNFDGRKKLKARTSLPGAYKQADVARNDITDGTYIEERSRYNEPCRNLPQPPKPDSSEGHTFDVDLQLKKCAYSKKSAKSILQGSQRGFTSSKTQLSNLPTPSPQIETNRPLLNSTSRGRTRENLSTDFTRESKTNLNPNQTIEIHNLSPNGRTIEEHSASLPASSVENQDMSQISSTLKAPTPRGSRKRLMNGNRAITRPSQGTVPTRSSGKPKSYGPKGQIISIISLMPEESEDELPNNAHHYSSSPPKQHLMKDRSSFLGNHQNRNCDGRAGSSCNRSFCLKCML